MRIKLEDLNDHYRKQAEAALNADRHPIPSAKQKQGGYSALGEETKATKFDTPVHIVFRIFHTGTNWDVDNAVPKSLLDGLCHARIIKNDNIEVLKGITIEGIRVRTRRDEKTEIEIYSADLESEEI